MQGQKKKTDFCSNKFGWTRFNKYGYCCCSCNEQRLPILFLPGDTYANRIPDPVLQQVEHFNNPSITQNDAFKPVTRYFDRITRPEQILQTLPQAIQVMLDPADCGPACISLSQDIQGETFEYPEEFFKERVHNIRRPVLMIFKLKRRLKK